MDGSMGRWIYSGNMVFVGTCIHRPCGPICKHTLRGGGGEEGATSLA